MRSRSRRLLGSLLRPHPRSLLLAAVLIACNTAAQLAGPLLVQVGIDHGIPPLLHGGSGTIRPLVTVVVALVVITLLGAATFNAFLMIVGRVGQDVILDLRRRVFVHFQELSLSFHERYTSGRVISRQTSDIEALADMLKFGIVTLVTSVLTIVGIAVVLVVLNAQLAIPVLAALPLLWLLTRWFRDQSERAYRATRDAIALVIVHFVESLGGIQAVHAFRREPRNQEIFEHLDDRYRRANVWSQRLAAAYGPGVQLVGRMTTAAIVVFYGGWLAIDGQGERRRARGVPPVPAAVLRADAGAQPVLQPVPGRGRRTREAVGRARGAAHGRAARGAGTARASARTRRVRRGRLRVPRTAGAHRPRSRDPGRPDDRRRRHDRRGQDDDRPPRGSVLGPDVGPGDARRHRPARSRPGRPPSRSSRSPRRTSSSPGRSPTTSASAVRAPRAEIEAAARAIGAHEFIAALPEGYDTDVHQKGARLSAGQRQLVAFARAFLADPAVLILDEATSSLDIPSERLVQRALRTLLADRTAVIIAHRLTTVEIADRVLVLDAAASSRTGRRELIGRGGTYAGLHQAWLDSLV